MKDVGFKKDFFPEEDYKVGIGCRTCGSNSNGHETADGIACDLCNSTDTYTETYHANIKCYNCNTFMEEGDIAYKNLKTGKHICKECYKKLEG